MNIKNVMINLKNQLLNDTDIQALVGDKVYISRNIIDDIQAHNVPIINIEFDSLDITSADNQNLSDFERHSYDINIQFAISNKDREEVIVGDNMLLDFYESIYRAIKADPTLDGTVDKFIKTPSLATDIFAPTQENIMFIAGGEMSLTFNKDVFIK